MPPVYHTCRYCSRVTADPAHIPVLLDEILALLDPQPGEVFVDCTAGLGGHAAAIAPRLVPGGTVILNDADPANLPRAAEHVGDVAGEGVQIHTIHGNFANVPQCLIELGLGADMVLADLGFASPQMADPARGLSFQREGPLDMRFDPTAPVTAAELVNTLPERELAQILHEFGEERASRRIARKLVEYRRAVGPITTTGQLAQIVRSVAGRRPNRGGIDPATRTFQALRIAVNDELGSLASLLEAIRMAAQRAASQDADDARNAWLRPGARVAIISFHSLEDRPVKKAFADLAAAGLAKKLTRKPIVAGEAELARNIRARSAKLRVAQLMGL